MAEFLVNSIIVGRNEFEIAQTPDTSYALMISVSDFVYVLRERGRLPDSSIPIEALQAAEVSDYLGQVNNGGHVFFYMNRGDEKTGKIATEKADRIRSGLAAMGANAQLAIFEESFGAVEEGKMELLWAAPPEQIAGMDRRFFEAEKARSIYALSADWIAGWPQLRIADDTDLKTERDELLASDPNGRRRAAEHFVRQLKKVFEDRDFVGESLACAALSPPEFMLGGQMVDWVRPDGKAGRVLQVRTTTTRGKLVHVGESFAAVYERVIDRPPVVGRTMVDRIKRAFGRTDFKTLASTGAPSTKLLSKIPGTEIDGFIKQAKINLAAEALGLLLIECELSQYDWIVRPKKLESSGVGTEWMVRVGNQEFEATVRLNEAELRDSERLLARVGIDEIRLFAETFVA